MKEYVFNAQTTSISMTREFVVKSSLYVEFLTVTLESAKAVMKVIFQMMVNAKKQIQEDPKIMDASYGSITNANNVLLDGILTTIEFVGQLITFVGPGI